MRSRMVRSSLGCSVISLLALIAGACQDYAFEELPSSVIKEKRYSITISLASDIDILFVMDNSGSMVGEQMGIASSFGDLTSVLDEKFGLGKYNIAVVTTGMESQQCGACNELITTSCINETGENGRFQDRLGEITDINSNPPTFVFESAPQCRIVTSSNLNCFFEDNGSFGKGIVFVGTNGCGYEKGLEPIRVALSRDLLGSANSGFLREDATLAVVVVSDEEDCGAVGDITEDPALGGKKCYYASKGVTPDGATTDAEGRPLTLTPVRDYYNFLRGLKGNRESMVKFAAIVGVEDEANPGATEIHYDGTATNSDILPACTTAGCVPAGPSDKSCLAYPGTRYVELAEMFGLEVNGLVGRICVDNFRPLMERIGNFVACPEVFKLSDPILDPALANILINDVEVPRYSCTVTGRIEECTGVGDPGCTEGGCVETWTYHEPTGLPGDPLGGTITFAEHYQPCDLFEGTAITEVKFEVIYVTG
jgi:hypothetical protein